MLFVEHHPSRVGNAKTETRNQCGRAAASFKCQGVGTAKQIERVGRGERSRDENQRPCKGKWDGGNKVRKG
jgi:hypothetical protein